MTVFIIGDSVRTHKWVMGQNNNAEGRVKTQEGILGAALIAKLSDSTVSSTGEFPCMIITDHDTLLGLRDSEEIPMWPDSVTANTEDTVLVYDMGLASRTSLPTSDASMIAFLQHQNLHLLTEVEQKEKVIPVLSMNDLRHHGAPISQRISWESTIIDFLRDMELGVTQHYLSSFPSFVVFLEQDGMIVKHNQQLTLYFVPDKVEGDSGSLGALGKREKLAAAIIQALPFPTMDIASFLPSATGKVALPSWSSIKDARSWSILNSVCGTDSREIMESAKHIVIHGEQTLLNKVPSCKFGALQAVDRMEIENYHAIVNLIHEYRISKDTRPLCVSVFGFPGSGKSFGIKQIAKTLGGFRTFTFNMSQFTSLRELEVAFQEIRDASIQGDALPLVFFDEFDSSFNGEALGWLKYFLAPMQDGTFMEDGRERPIGRALFVFAGGTSVSFNQFIEQEKDAFKRVKGPDFISRLKGYLNIQGPNPINDHDHSYLIRRAMLLRSMIGRGAKQLLDANGKTQIDENILHALLSTNMYKHGARSIEFFISMSPIGNTSKWHASLLPPKSQMNIHVDAEEFITQISILSLSNEMAKRSHELYVKEYLKANPTGVSAALVPWSQLDETYRRSNRQQILFLLERFKRSQIGIRQATTPNYLFTFLDEDLHQFSQDEHERWSSDRIKDGWSYGVVRDNAKKLHNCLVPWDQLTEAEKQLDRDVILKIPTLLNEIGFELYYQLH